MRLSVVIPCYRSGPTLPPLVERLVDVLPTISTAHEVILVVDGPIDDTYAVARRLEREHPGVVKAVLMRRNYGQHNALIAGLSRASYDVTVTMDDDLQHRPEEIHKLLAPLEDPLVDLVYGVADEEEHGLLRSFASRTVKAALATAGVPNAKDVSAFRAFRTDLREGFSHVADPFASLDVFLSWTTTSIQSVPVRMEQRQEGESGYSFSSLVRHAMNMVTGYSTFPLKMVTRIGIGAALFGFALALYVLVQHFRGEIRVAGFTTLASLLSILSGLIMLSIGVLGEYLGRLHFRSMARPTYIVRTEQVAVEPRAGLPGTVLPHVAEGVQPDDVAAALERRFAPRDGSGATRA